MHDRLFRNLPGLVTAFIGVLMVSPQLAAQAQRMPAMEELPQPVSVSVMRLEDLERIALERNPTLVQAGTQIDAARGRALQAGLYPNPTVGYNGEQIGLRGRAAPGEQQGIFIDQTFVTAGKLKLSQSKFGQEVAQMEWQAAAQQYRVVNGVRVRYYQLLAMQRLIALRKELLKLAEDVVSTAEELVNVGQANRPDLLQARIEGRQARVAVENAQALYEAAWQQLVAFLGNPRFGPTRLEGDLESGELLPTFDETLVHLLQASPEIQIAQAEVARNQFGLQRERVEPIPNVQMRVSSGWDFESRTQTATVNAGVRLPVFDKNQGNIQAALAQLTRSQAEYQRVELSLQRRLAKAFGQYRTALVVVENYRKDNLPDAKEAYELYAESFQRRRAAYPQVLIAQRSYFQMANDYIQALEQLRRTEVEIRGLLLVDGLEEPPGPPGEGRVRQSEDAAGTLPEPLPSQGRLLEDRGR